VSEGHVEHVATDQAELSPAGTPDRHEGFDLVDSEHAPPGN
jgi:hypothetical protein